MKVYTDSELRKTIKALLDKYEKYGAKCEPLPYIPESIEVELLAKEKIEEK